jgi:phage terminase large subunit
MNLKTTVVYEHLENSKNRIVVLQGGARSSKTYQVLIWFIVKLLNENNKVLTICRQSAPTMQGTVIRDFVEILDKLFGIYDPNQHHTQEKVYYLGTNTVEFVSTSEPEKIRGRKRDYLYLNEATEIEQDAWIQLLIRTSGKVVLDFNPTCSEFHWIRANLLKRTDIDYYITTFRDNPFLSENERKELEGLKETADENYYRQFNLGQFGNNKAQIFTHWKLVDDLRYTGEIVYGLDFGSTDPTALVMTEITEGSIYVKELLYETNLTQTDIIKRLRQIGIKHHEKIYADSSRPDTIEDIRRAGFNIIGAKKGAGSIVDGISKIRSMPLYVCRHSKNMIKEFGSYNWIEKDGIVTNKPIDDYCHAIDALRYSINDFLRPKATWVAIA